MTRAKITKAVLWTIGIVLMVMVVLILFISPLMKYLVEKYDEKIIGRQIEMDMCYANPFTGYLHFSDVKIYEMKSDSVFLHADRLSANITMYKLLRGVYEVNEIQLRNPYATFIQGDSSMNIDDIIHRFSKKDTVKVTEKKSVEFDIKRIVIENGEFHYRDNVIPVRYHIKKVNVYSTGFQWNRDTMGARFNFISGNDKGTARGNFTINTNTQDYRLSTIIEKYDLKFIEQYMLDFAKYGNFEANLDADLHATGNFKDAEKLDARGVIAMNKFRFGKSEKDNYASFDRAVLGITQLNPAQHIYMFDSAIVRHPYIKYERYDYLDNYSVMFGRDAQNVTSAAQSSRFNLILEVADYVKELSRNFFSSNYKVNRIDITDAHLVYNDYALNEKFYAELNPLNIFSDSLAKKEDRVRLSLNSGIKPYGNVSLFMSINPRDSSDFDLSYKIEKIPMAMFNPYLITYTSFPMDRGSMQVTGKWHVRDGKINSNNHIIVVDPRLGNRIKKKDAQRLPLPLIMYFVRERGNVIDYEIPVTGNLDNPKFHWRDVVLDILSNIFAKPPTIPYRLKVNQVENEIEKALTFKWEMRQIMILNEQERFMHKMAKFLEDNPDASISIYPELFEAKEKENILFYEAKKKYYLQANRMTEDNYSVMDSIKVEKMSIRDSGFTFHLQKAVKKKSLYTIQDKCAAFLGNSNKVNAEYKRLAKAREKAFTDYFKSRGVHNKIKFHSGTTKIPFNGFSIYRIEYKGEIPYSLYKAYSEMNDLDDEPPRRRFKKERRKEKKASKMP